MTNSRGVCELISCLIKLCYIWSFSPHSDKIPPTYWEFLDQTKEYDEFRKLQNKRRQNVRDICRRYNITNGKLGEGGYNLMVDDHGKFVFCSNYKAI